MASSLTAPTMDADKIPTEADNLDTAPSPWRCLSRGAWQVPMSIDGKAATLHVEWMSRFTLGVRPEFRGPGWTVIKVGAYRLCLRLAAA